MPATIITSDWRGEARGAKPKRSRSQRGMEACIISTAQQASPNVIHISEPVRAQLMRSSVVVTRKPLSASCVRHLGEVGITGFHQPGLAACGRHHSCLLPIADCRSSQSHSSAPLRHS